MKQDAHTTERTAYGLWVIVLTFFLFWPAALWMIYSNTKAARK